jgi:hypothetical protein
MDLNEAIKFAQLVNAAYAAEKGPVPDTAPYVLIATVFANDLATELNPDRGKNRIEIALILQNPGTGEAVIAIRGTEGILEWTQDGKFLLVPCPFLPSAGHTEDGFTAMYNSMTVGAAAGSPSVRKAISDPAFGWKKPVSSLTICGHSLGGALATLLALDVAANTPFPPFTSPTVYTYASPRTGGPQFVSTYNHVVPDTLRIANRLDIVPKLPLPPLYDHVLGLVDLNPVKKVIPLEFWVKPEIPCLHILTSYLHLLSREAGITPPLPLDAKC